MHKDPVAVRGAVERRQVREVDLRAAVAGLNDRVETARAGVAGNRRQVEDASRIGVEAVARKGRQSAERGRGAVMRGNAAVRDARDLRDRGGRR